MITLGEFHLDFKNIFVQMKAIRKSLPQKGLWMEDVPIPEPGVNEVLVKISKSAVCGTDLTYL